MLNFYPGPSKLDAKISQYYQEAIATGILEQNHRSAEFTLLYQQLKKLFHTKLLLPYNYDLIFLSSATEAWEVISQSFVLDASTHFFNGAFGEKWFQYAEKINSTTKAYKFGLLDVPKLQIDGKSPELIALTHNETSIGTFIPETVQEAYRKAYPNCLIAIDATSSMAGLILNWELGDIWFASVQKCFGLPAGLGVMVVSPAAIEKARQIKEGTHYNSFLFMLENAKKWQTHYTPNVANIFLLKRVLENRPLISTTHEKLLNRSKSIYNAISELKHFQALVSIDQFRSPTIICLKAEEDLISKVKKEALRQNILLGNGYGELKDSTIRIANFPAIKDEDFERLLLFLADFDKRY